MNSGQWETVRPVRRSWARSEQMQHSSHLCQAAANGTEGLHVRRHQTGFHETALNFPTNDVTPVLSWSFPPAHPAFQQGHDASTTPSPLHLLSFFFCQKKRKKGRAERFRWALVNKEPNKPEWHSSLREDGRQTEAGVTGHPVF